MCRKIGANVDPTHRSQWENMLNPSSDLGLILKSIKCDFKFVCLPSLFYPILVPLILTPLPFSRVLPNPTPSPLSPERLAGWFADTPLHQPIEFPDSITVYHKLHSISTHSFTLDAVVISEKHQRVAAKLHEDLVTYQYAGGEKPGKVHVPGWMREVFEETLKLQEMEKRRVQEEMQGIEGIVRELEGRVMGRKELHS